MAGFAFVWWWFPKWWQKGILSDMKERDEIAMRNMDDMDPESAEGQGRRHAMITDPITGERRKPTMEERVQAIHAARAYEDRVPTAR